ncbi:MAG: DUF3854 domain-containing protein [Gemmataceae bacterium]|nr:DUF3854 domain-containing protein [Gemmataceae bacterium]
MAKFQWVRVSQHSPCPVCKRPDWCSTSADGTVAKCMRVEQGCFRSKEDKGGGHYYLHRLADGSRPEAPLPPRPGPEAKRADPDTLHAVYTALLGRLALSKAHRETLYGRGLSDEVIDRAGYRTLPIQGRPQVVRDLSERFGDRLLRVPGFVLKDGRFGPYLTLRGPAGLLVPCRDLAGQIVALKVRRDETDAAGPRYVYLSSSGYGGPSPGTPVHLPLGTLELAEVVRVTEGELKADIIQARTGVPTLSIPGAGNWRGCLDTLKQLGCKVVRLAFDADAGDKPTVARALYACAESLAQAGYAVELERWAAADGKGLDDLLTAGKTPELLQGDVALQAVQEILATATSDGEPALPDELGRLQDVLDSGGAEALFRDKALMQALASLATTDPAGFAAVRASIRERVSLRDLNKSLRSFRRQTAPGGSEESATYFEQRGCIHRNVQTKDGPVAVALCNFSARIVEDVVHDDGAEQARYLALEGKLVDGRPLPRGEVPAADFPSMGWVVPAWGTRAVVYAGQGTKDHLRAALQLLSGDVPRRTVYRHIGWRQIEGIWSYLHAGGAIGATGLDERIPVSLPEPLAGFRLPAPPEGAELRDAIRASLGLLNLGPDQATVPLLAAVYRAAMGDTDFALHLAGPTGCFKSEAAALAQQHFGAGMDARHLPASWSSTGNALEALAFTAKDALLVVDDFCPTGSVSDVQRYHKEADRLFRGQGNRAGRQRMRADASLRPAKPPRGLTVSTGEDTPRGQSLRARLLVEEISPGDFGPLPPDPNPRLSACQRDAAEGKYAASLAGFLRWLAPQYENVRSRLRAEIIELRNRASATGQHARTPGIVADLALGLRYCLDFARSINAISEAEREDLWQRGWEGLTEAAAAQATHITAAEPAGMFLRLLSAAVASGYAHIADREGNEPSEPHRWGWRAEEFYTGDGTDTRHKPQGVRVGWLVDGELYLEPEASFAAVQRFARDQGDSFAITANTLRRRLKEKGLLATTDTARGKLTVRRTLQGARRDVLHLAWHGCAFAPQTGPTGPEEEGDSDEGPQPWATSGAEHSQQDGETAHGTVFAFQPNGALGRLGRSARGESACVTRSNLARVRSEGGGFADDLGIITGGLRYGRIGKRHSLPLVAVKHEDHR